MLKKQLEDYILQLYVKPKADETDMDRLWDLYLDGTVTTDERRGCMNEYANAFWCLCTKWEGFSENKDFSRHINKMINFISFFYAISSVEENGFYECKELVFIRFLAWLRDRKGSYNVNQDNRFYDFYRKLNDVIGQVKWVFELEDKGERVFPIHRLLEDVAISFKLNEEHYLQVIFSLQLFNRIEKISDDKGSIRVKMLEIANEFHIHLIEMLCDGGEILYGGNAGINSAKNGTIVAILKDEILIRNVDKAYFNGNKYDFEGVDEENAIAYYYIYKKQKDEIPQTFAYIMKHCPMLSKQTVLRELMKSKIYNVFLGEVFLVNSQTNMFTKVINTFSENDDYLISDGNIVESKKTLYETFWNQMQRDQNGLRTCTIAQRGNINVLTLDFIIEFSVKLCSEENDCLAILTELSEEDFFQNQLLKVYIEEELHNGRIFSALRKYAKFLSDYMNISQVSAKTKFAEYPNLIMPYSIYVPFGGVIQDFFEALKKERYVQEEVILEELKSEVGIGNICVYKVAGEIIPEEKIYNIAGVRIENSRIRPGYCFFAREKKQVYLLGEYDDVIDVLIRISTVSSKYVISKQWLDIPTHLDRLIRIITNIGFDNVIYKNLGTVYKDVFVSNIALYKFLWLMQIFQFDKSKYDKFEELILNGFYCSFALEPDKMMKKYLGEIEILSENNALIIAKEPDGVGATLNLMIERYSSGDRGSLRMAFDGNTINKNLKEHDGVYYYRNVPVKEIVFLTDNSLSGKSTVDMLKYYLKGKKSSDDRRSYIFGKNLLPDVLNKNANVKIIVKTIFYSERASKRIQREFPEYEISITGDMLAGNSFQWTEEKNEIIRELFGNASETVHKNAQCVLRPCNLPYDQVLPDILKDPANLIGIFRRKDH